MTTRTDIDGALVQWGERLFYPRNRVIGPMSTPRLSFGVAQRAANVRRRIEATVVRRAPQVMVRLTGGGRGMAAIAVHFRYITRNGRLAFEDDRGVLREGKDALRDLADQWRYGGSFIEQTTSRREAFNIMLSMPRGTDPQILRRAAQEFARAEVDGHRYVMVLHDDQGSPHVHLSVRAESRYGTRLNPTNTDLRRWRETFAEKLRGWGIDAEASWQATRGQECNYEPLWRLRAAERGELTTALKPANSGPKSERSRQEAVVAWAQIVRALARSDDPEDRALAAQVDRYVRATPFALRHARRLEQRRREQDRAEHEDPTHRSVDRLKGPQFER
jgi:hypothetical protein